MHPLVVTSLVVLLLSSCGTTSAATPTPTPTVSGHTLRSDLDLAGSCAKLAADFTYLLVDDLTVQDGQTYVTYRDATMHCGGPDDYQYALQPGTHHVFVDPDAEVVLIHEGPGGIVEEPSTAANLPAAYAAQHGAYPVFAIRHSSVGHADALVQRFHP
jgi:hypothetical protein